MRKNILKYEYFYGPYLNDKAKDKNLKLDVAPPYDDALRRTLDS